MSTIIKTENTDVHVDDYDESPEGVYHISVRNKDGDEIGYWTKDEIAEDTVSVLGAIFGAIKQGSAGAVRNGRAPSSFRFTVAVDLSAESREDAKDALDRIMGSGESVLGFSFVKEGFIE